MAIPPRRVVPGRVGYMDAEAVLRQRPIPPPGPPSTERGSSARTITRLDAGQRVQLAALRSPTPRWFVVQALSPSIAVVIAYFEVQFSLGGAEAPPIRFQKCGPLSLYADTVTLTVVNPTTTNLAGLEVHGSIVASEAPAGPARPLWVNPDTSLNVAIAAAATQAFNLSRYTRRVRVGRLAPGTAFTTLDSMMNNTGATVSTAQVTAANGEFSWREIVTPQIQVTNNAAAPDNFTVYEELGL